MKGRNRVFITDQLKRVISSNSDTLGDVEGGTRVCKNPGFMARGPALSYILKNVAVRKLL